MNIFRVYAVALRYWYLLRGHPQRVFQVFIWGTFDMLLWGFLTRYLSTTGMNTLNFTTVLLGALILWQFVSRVQQSFVIVFLEDIYTRNFLNVFSSPLSIFEYVGGIVAMAAFMTIAAFAFVASLASFIFGLSLPLLSISLIYAIAILTCSGLAIGILAAAVVLRLGPSAEWFVWPLSAMIQPFVGVFYPISVLPEWMQSVASMLPPAYAFEAFRAVVDSGATTEGLALPFVLALGYLLGAAYLFAVAYRWALRSGAIVRYGAEAS